MSNDNIGKFLQPRRYLRWSLGQFNKRVLSAGEGLLAPSADEPLAHSPIFILGAPRSGSTLAVQVLTDTLDLGYLSNRHCQWFGAPALAERLFRPTRERPASDFHSEQGTTRGYHAPAECGQWWYRFFRRSPPYVTLEEVDPRRMRQFRRSVSALTRAFDRPILFKNLYASLRVQAIARYLPESLFIVMHRDEVENGESLLEARYRRFQSYAPWLSVEPPGVEQLARLPAHAQVIEQIRHTHRTIEHDLALAGVAPARRFDLVYERFCRDPGATVERFRGFLAENGCTVQTRDAPPARFFPRREVRIDRDLYERLEAYARQGTGNPGDDPAQLTD